MKRSVLACLILLAALAGTPPPAAAQSSMDVVPPLDWTYSALNLLQLVGELEDYPAGYFDVDGEYRAEHGVALRRYELEQAVARARVSTWNKLSWQQDYVLYLVSDLCHAYNALPNHNPDPQLDACQCHWVVDHGLAVPEDHWSYSAVQELLDAGVIEEQPGLPAVFPLGQADMAGYTRQATEAMPGWTGDATQKSSLQITVECLERQYFDPFAPFRTGYQTITDWICPALDYAAATGYIAGYPNDYFNVHAPHFDKAETMPTMEDCLAATRELEAKLSALREAGAAYPPHLDYMAADLVAICKPLAPPEEDQAKPAAEEAEEEPKRRVRFKHDDDPFWK